MSTFPRTFQNSRGFSMVFVVMAVLFLSVSAYFGQQLLSSKQFMSGRKASDKRLSVELTSAIETLLVSYRWGEKTYVKAVAGCAVANAYLTALKEGSGCPGIIKLFDLAAVDPSTVPDGVTGQALYRYMGAGCVIEATRSSCKLGLPAYMEVLAKGKKGVEVTYRVSLKNLRPEDKIIDFLLTDSGGRSQGVGIRTSFYNAAHLESDGRLVQETPDVLDNCPGNPWSDYLVYDSNTRQCVSFARIGSGTGLATYKGRYFGFRPMDGTVVDMMAASLAASYMVGEDGKIEGVPVFPAHSRDLLMNVDDITVIGEHVYYVTGLGSAAKLGVLGLSGRVTVCDLGTLGWAQAYAGITAHGLSDPLLSTVGDGLVSRLATFYLKTDSGDLITAIVEGTAAGGPYTCSAFKEDSIQADEYRRTLGFERVAEAMPYFLF